MSIKVLLCWFAVTVVVVAVVPLRLGAWGSRGHVVINRVAVQALPDDGPVFLKAREEWIAQTGPLPDNWRDPAEPFVKIVEDPNHHWYKEAFAFLKTIPRSRYEFVIALHEQYLRVGDNLSGERLMLPNIFAGTLPYEAVEVYERLKATMRLYRRQRVQAPGTRHFPDVSFTEEDLAFLAGWLGHYIGDGAQPQHDSVNVSGWRLSNPNGYTTDPSIHARFETEYLELLSVTPDDVRPLVRPARVIDDPFEEILAHLDRSAARVEEVYRLDKEGAFRNRLHAAAKSLVLKQLAAASELLRDLLYTAWIESATPLSLRTPATDPTDRANPRYNPATGSAPAIKP
jgi:hypothetical protein